MIIKLNNYDIEFTNNIENIKNQLSKYEDILMIIDSNVDEIYKDLFDYNKIVIKCTENTKNLDTVYNIYEKMETINVKKGTIIVSFGGGILQDIVGFVASSFLRGLKHINIPTTLLSQVDSSIGGKVGVNFKGNKNYIGAFYDPIKVFINTDFIKTCKDNTNGIAEIIKSFLIKDKESFIKLKNDFIIDDKTIYNALIVKKNIVELDKFESNIRKKLNFGHTLGHVIEKHSKFKISHGNAISIGMYKIVNNNIRKDLEILYNKFSLNKDYNNLEEALLEVKFDKKSNKNSIDLILLKNIGDSYIKNVKLTEIGDYLI